MCKFITRALVCISFTVSHFQILLHSGLEFKRMDFRSDPRAALWCSKAVSDLDSMGRWQGWFDMQGGVLQRRRSSGVQDGCGGEGLGVVEGAVLAEVRNLAHDQPEPVTQTQESADAER